MTKSEPRELRRARTIARVLDGIVPLPGGQSVGVDAILGLIPGVGDFGGAAASGYIVVLAIRAGASRTAVVRMIGNITVDTLIGSIPLFGDLFDLGWQSNLKNVAIMERDLVQAIEEDMAGKGLRRRSSKVVLLLILLGVFVALAGLAYIIGAFLWLIVARLF